jgi:hypothetical protein
MIPCAHSSNFSPTDLASVGLKIRCGPWLLQSGFGSLNCKYSKTERTQGRVRVHNCGKSSMIPGLDNQQVVPEAGYVDSAMRGCCWYSFNASIKTCLYTGAPEDQCSLFNSTWPTARNAGGRCHVHWGCKRYLEGTLEYSL